MVRPYDGPLQPSQRSLDAIKAQERLQDEERERFEAYLSVIRPCVVPVLVPGEHSRAYDSPLVQIAWECWCGAKGVDPSDEVA